MPAEHIKPLRYGRCLDDLKQRYEINMKIEDPNRLSKAAHKLFSEAATARRNGDEELSYIYYMKFLSLTKKLEGRTFEAVITRQQVNEALDIAEILSLSLKSRYEEQRKEEQLNQSKHIAIEGNVKEIDEKPEATEKVNGFADVTEQFISCEKLYKLLFEKKQKILLMDVRTSSLYEDSHLKADCIINIPESVVEAGMTSAKLEKTLPITSKTLWYQRGNVDLIVLIDSSSSVNNFNPKSALAVVRDILLKWDADFQYTNEPCVLDKGYNEWLLRYPVHTTNPSPSSFQSVDDVTLNNFLNNVDYPDLSESSESIQPTIDRSSKPTLKIPFTPIPVVAWPTLPVSGLKSTTPSLSNYLPQNPAKIHSSNTFIDAPLKPSAPSKGSSAASVDLRPSVDRKSKAAALATYEERSRNIQALLHREEEVVVTSLELEKDKLRIEEERENIRLRREMEAEEEMRTQLQEREDQLLRDIQNLELLQKEKDKENQKLREELEKYKMKERDENLPKEYSVFKHQEEAIAARIRNTEEKRKKMARDYEKKVLEEYRSAKKKLTAGNDANLSSKPPLTHEEREKEARAKLHLDRMEKERQRQGHSAGSSSDRLSSEDSKKNRSPNKIASEVNRDKKPPEIAKEQPSTFKNKVNGTSTVPLKDTSSGIMKRSRSSPNIAQMSDDDLNGRGLPYKANFPLDVRPSRQRNFSPVYGDMGRGLTGLKNLGNTCYMNSIIQCLSNTTPLAKYFVSGQYRKDLNRHNETRGEIAEEVAAVVRALWSSSYKCIATRDLRSVVGKYRDQFQTNQQQDSNEFLTIVMDWLHEDLKKPSVKSMGDVEKVQQDWEKQWSEFYKENSSLIVFLFYGQQKSTVKCLKCCKESVRYETFSNLTLPLPSNSNACTLEDCVQLYVKGEHISGWKCPACKEPRDAMKKFDIIKLPPILIIHFKRFYIDGWCRKRQTFVQFPLVDWDMRKYTLLPEQKYTKYDLYGVSNHYGTMEGGHYTAYCKSVEHKKWYKFDDNEVSEISPVDVQSGAAYILFYASLSLNIREVS